MQSLKLKDPFTSSCTSGEEKNSTSRDKPRVGGHHMLLPPTLEPMGWLWVNLCMPMKVNYFTLELLPNSSYPSSTTSTTLLVSSSYFSTVKSLGLLVWMSSGTGALKRLPLCILPLMQDAAASIVSSELFWCVHKVLTGLLKNISAELRATWPLLLSIAWVPILGAGTSKVRSQVYIQPRLSGQLWPL